MNWPTDPPIHPPIHLSKGGSVSTNHKSSNRIQLSRLDDVLLEFLVISHDSTHWPTHPPNHTPWNQTLTHGWESLHRSSNLQTEFEISRFVQDLIRIFTDLGGDRSPGDPPIPTHSGGGGNYPKVGVCSTNHKSSNRIQLSRLDDDLLDF